MEKSKIGKEAEECLQNAVNEAILEYKLKGIPIVVRRDKK
jgi:hypothetical protein